MPEDIFTEEEYQKILDICDDQDRNFIKFMFWSGLRPAEAVVLERGDFVDGILNVNKTLNADGSVTEPKTSSGTRRLPLTPPARSAIEEQLKSHRFKRIRIGDGTIKKDSPYFFSGTHWETLLKRAKVRYRKPYTMRHNFASWLLVRGESERTVAFHMGHKNVNTIRNVYGHFIAKVDGLWASFS